MEEKLPSWSGGCSRHRPSSRSRGGAFRRSLEIYDEVKFDRLLERNVAWPRPSENLVDKFSGTPE
jgi:hypothetical protein